MSTTEKRPRAPFFERWALAITHENKDSLAIQLKLNELVAALDGASNRLIDVESLSGHDLEVLHAHYQRLATMARESANIGESHSIEEAERRHRRKTGKPRS